MFSTLKKKKNSQDKLKH